VELASFFEAADPPDTDRITKLQRQACDFGDAEACMSAAQSGRDTAELELRACHLGSLDGCASSVARLERSELTVSVDQELALYESACERGNSTACVELASRLRLMEPRRKNAAAALRLLENNCNSDVRDPRACSLLAELYESGQGVDRDRTEASRFYDVACSGGDAVSCFQRGMLLTGGVGVRRDDRQAAAMLDTACSYNLPAACFHVGRLWDEATYLDRNGPLAADYYQTACDGGVAAACTGLGRLYEDGSAGQVDFASARVAYEQAIEMGSVEANRRLSRLLWRGLGGTKSRKRARELCATGCQSGGDPTACRGPSFQ